MAEGLFSQRRAPGQPKPLSEWRVIRPECELTFVGMVPPLGSFVMDSAGYGWSAAGAGEPHMSDNQVDTVPVWDTARVESALSMDLISRKVRERLLLLGCLLFGGGLFLRG
jgi:hypothetical protein